LDRKDHDAVLHLEANELPPRFVLDVDPAARHGAHVLDPAAHADRLADVLLGGAQEIADADRFAPRDPLPEPLGLAGTCGERSEGEDQDRDEATESALCGVSHRGSSGKWAKDTGDRR